MLGNLPGRVGNKENDTEKDNGGAGHGFWVFYFKAAAVAFFSFFFAPFFFLFYDSIMQV